MKRHAFAEDKPTPRAKTASAISCLKAGDKVLVIYEGEDYDETEGVVLMTSGDSIAVNCGGAAIQYFHKNGEEIVFGDDPKHRLEPA